MQFDPSKGTPPSPSASLSLKRSFAQQVAPRVRKAPRIETAEASTSSPSSSKGAVGRCSSSVFSPEFEMPTSPSSDSSPLISNSRSRGGSFGPRATHTIPPAFKAAKSKGRGKRSTESGAIELEGPLRDKNYIHMQYDQTYPGITPLKHIHAQNPKSTLSNWYINAQGTLPQYECLGGVLNGRHIWRYVLCCCYCDPYPELCVDVL